MRGHTFVFCPIVAANERTRSDRNAVVADMAIGGSTNAIVHLIAMARRAGTPLTLERFDELWMFLEHPDVEPTNNAAERALRHAVIWRKLSFGTQSTGGSRFVETMLTVIETCRQQHRNVFNYLTAALHSHLAHQPPCCPPASRGPGGAVVPPEPLEELPAEVDPREDLAGTRERAAEACGRAVEAAPTPGGGGATPGKMLAALIAHSDRAISRMAR